MPEHDQTPHPREFPRIQPDAPEIVGFFPSAFEEGESYAIIEGPDGRLCTWFDGTSISVRGETSALADESFRGDRDEILRALEDGAIMPLTFPYRAPTEPYIAVRSEAELLKILPPEMQGLLSERRGVEDEIGRVWIRCEQNGMRLNYWYHITSLAYYEKYLAE